jgi:hypothetical protein
VDARSLIPRLTDIIEAIERIHAVSGDIPLDVFEIDWQRQWLPAVPPIYLVADAVQLTLFLTASG